MTVDFEWFTTVKPENNISPNRRIILQNSLINEGISALREKTFALENLKLMNLT